MGSSEKVTEVGKILLDKKQPLKDRFRALFTLRNLGGEEAIASIAACFDDKSALLKHELAYCLGQMQDPQALPHLISVLEDKSQEAMVRHEAGEALGAIGDPTAIEILEKYVKDPVIEVAETCELALGRLRWLQRQNNISNGSTDESKTTDECDLPDNPYHSVDPAPPARVAAVEELRATLLDENLPLFQRYRAMFTLRNLSSTESVLALAKGLKCSSALFRHEIAYVLGQIQSPASIDALTHNLRDNAENPMVRHECAEALGAIATPEAMDVLQEFLSDPERVVRESCVVALDLSEYENSGQFQYADGLKCNSALFRHEIAYVLGQIQSPASIDALTHNLRDSAENPMVRHECAEALGAIATPEAMDVLQEFLSDPERVVRESCVVALDLSEYENSGQFQYADGLSKVESSVHGGVAAQEQTVSS
ncbi:deoxyhypusine hydroxylase [Plakobranchus ocellatus]|uniref:Deoxyhypusine hydroxylase n=1 Tax=Plakobranchus ocellatus TaxID=259542 RepID=A0AAV4AV05_9GAST|nr:deoxyhypusine hydroxylase [Plakobranchus ocellatus]